tara:strand:- start:421 stop:642 length:222 start_codon:yes stop_codon:yes gene_type:complete
MKYTLELEDGSTVELNEEQYKAVQTLNNNHKQRIRELERAVSVLARSNSDWPLNVSDTDELLIDILLQDIDRT